MKSKACAASEETLRSQTSKIWFLSLLHTKWILETHERGDIFEKLPQFFCERFHIYRNIENSEHLPPLHLDFTANISLYLLYYIFIHLYITLFILVLDAFLGNLETPIYFILSTSACVSLRKKLLGIPGGSTC